MLGNLANLLSKQNVQLAKFANAWGEIIQEEIQANHKAMVVVVKELQPTVD